MDTNTLISFLGKSRQNKETGYQKSDYDLNGKILTTAFFGVELARALHPKKLLLIGTSGSMWDVLFEQHSTDEKVLNLIDAVANQSVTETMLNELAPQMEQYVGCEVKCVIIEYAKTETEQVNLLHRIAQELTNGETLSLDVTHSFRHLPMLALVAARFLKSTKNIQTQHIYYGAFEMRNEHNRTPVIDLNGMLTMLDWVDALSAYKQSDNYAVFSPLLDKENAQLLQQAAFFENINQVHQARSPLSKFHHNLNNKQIDNAFVSLVQDDLSKRIEWAQGSSQYDHQLSLAKRNLENGDYWQASIRANETWVSKMVQAEHGNQSNYTAREEAQKNFTKYAQDCDVIQFEDLKAIRNAMAHGTRANRRGIPEILSDENKLRQKLNEVIQRIQKWKMENELTKN